MLLIYQMKTAYLWNSQIKILLNCQIRKWLIFDLQIYKMKSVNLWHKDFVNLSNNNFDNL